MTVRVFVLALLCAHLPASQQQELNQPTGQQPTDQQSGSLVSSTTFNAEARIGLTVEVPAQLTTATRLLSLLLNWAGSTVPGDSPRHDVPVVRAALLANASYDLSIFYSP